MEKGKFLIKTSNPDAHPRESEPPTAFGKQPDQFICLTCQIIKEFDTTESRGNKLQSQTEREASATADGNPQTADKKIPFVRNSHSALLQCNQLPEQVSLRVSAEIMLL